MTERKPPHWIPASITLLGILISIAPLCGHLFGCGCTWPWSGLAENCNYFDPLIEDPCPFCASFTLSVPLLSGIALIALGVSGAEVFRKLPISGSILLGSLGGLILFVLLTTFAGSFIG